MNNNNVPLLSAFAATGLVLVSSQSRADWWSDNVAPIGHAAEKAVQDTGHTVEKALQDTGHTGEKAADDTGHTLEKAAHDTGHALEKAGQDTGHSTNEVGNFVKEHPWETVAAVALVAGGGYLILYQGYTLSITVEGAQVFSVTCGATCGAVAGSALAGVGTGGITYVAMTQSNARPPSSDTESQDAKARTDTANLNSSSMGRELSDGANQQSVMSWPRLPERPSNWDRLDYADHVSTWAEQMNPIGSFDPARSPQPTQSEIKLLDALTGLYAIPDSEGAKMAKEQAEESKHSVANFASDQAVDKVIEKVIEVTVSHSAATAYSVAGDIKTAISPVVIGDDVADRRDSLKKQLEQQLHAYEIRRNPQAQLQPLNAATILMPPPPPVELKPN